MSGRAGGRWAAVCIAAGAILVLVTIARTSLTQDEPSFYSYGARVVSDGTFARPLQNDDSKLPAAALNVLPARLARWAGLRGELAASPLQHWLVPEEAAYVSLTLDIYSGRLVTLGFYIALCWLVFLWGREIYGPPGALAATALIAFLPLLLGHAGLVTADAAATCTIFAAVYALARCLTDPSLQAALLAGLALGAAQLVKYTAVDLYAIACVMLVVRVATAERTERRLHVLHAGITALVFAGLIAVVVINVGFAFQGTGVRLTELPCYSRACRWLAGVVGSAPLPLPYEYVHGLDLVSLHDQQEVGGGNVYLLGRLSRSGFASYYVVATALKTPLPFFALVLIRPWRRQRRYTDLVLLAPVVCLLVHLSFFFHTQLGLRFLLPAFPFLALLAAANWDDQRSRQLRLGASGLLGVHILTALLHCPRYLGYCNLLIGSHVNAYRYLADSNLDWGQDQFALWSWERAHAGVPYALTPAAPTDGLIIVRVNDFVGIDDPQTFRWLRERAAPVTTIGDAYLLFDLPPGTSAAPRHD